MDSFDNLKAQKTAIEHRVKLGNFDLIEQLCQDLNQAHDELMKIQGEKSPKGLDWPEWTPQANSIREAEMLIGKKLAKTDAWTMFPVAQRNGAE